ncbi:hypothetical protein CKA55_11900 [Arcobacter suis]|uniref:Uncharacterized protein n=1 Tax=Arcobacter suis CECT 7833 TaxID=663365 RepID=A0AAD0WR39_9BACT|nr:hypothetical protein [Arcobacter suis]AXX90390.1 hypothetical protein ASUIS_1928 [Arcobacter suis CECT 7833]RWS45581.1 hypothetical protein CKA55_11900 [Arcobacter suis]
MRINNIKSNLQFYLMTTGKTLKDLKVEVILIFCLKLIREYIQSEDNKIDFGYSCYMTNEEQNLIYTKLKELESSLLKHIFTIEEIYKIIIDKSSKESIIKAIVMEPRLYFYDVIVKRFISKMNLFSDNGKNYYIPEMLALYLIIDMKEKGYSFKDFRFIEEFDFLNLIEIYNKINLQIKKMNDIKINTPLMNQTTISKMQHLSLYLTNVLAEAKYINKQNKV